ncbi:hypothetical protein [Litchfieldia salsa]|uniref:hypothetical protein n=1 Tax=Litchfieldia salsa TaxID=930152 RepID=UPI001EE4B4F9|nr:hypothetical protein [Litchfieldia salsa]
MNHRRLRKSKEKDHCPECRGKGFHAFAGSDFFVSDPAHCSGCNGSGLFDIWQKRNPF